MSSFVDFVVDLVGGGNGETTPTVSLFPSLIVAGPVPSSGRMNLNPNNDELIMR